MYRIEDFDQVLVIDGKTHGIAKIVYCNEEESKLEYIRFYTTALGNDNTLQARCFDLSKEDATTFLQNYGHKTIYIGILEGECDKLLNGFTI